ncbi:ABC transporter permease [Methylovirgula ligni]|uniref:NitT/TauT family transport system permease protein n=1 Tax=Methylovirgula ligni TaxID=569860 RepID=A0A3D9YYK3_9HYPH|nr:ABC transporter permease [Methylovirgula ligni]QAY94331.1 ABC transporter permease [Methylovirgula ligni]REF87833.1 NitT/TauT family transport system permease protein [Methylovirgula ligni]
MSEADLTHRAEPRAATVSPAFLAFGRGFRALRRSFLARRLLVLVLLAIAWQLAATYKASPLLFPSFTETLSAFFQSARTEDLLSSAGESMLELIKGYALAISIALVLVSLATTVPFMRDVLQTLTAIFNPLPAIALLPLAMLWFGLGEASLLLVLVHSVVWPFSLAALTGFEQVPETQRLVGRNYGLTGLRYIFYILLPAALPSILSGLRVAWAFAWRTLIASELVFGVSSGTGGLGWFIYRNRNDLLTDRVFAGLATVILIGLVVEFAIFHLIERYTVERWGMQRAAQH